MAISKQKKADIVKKVKEGLSKAKTIVFVNFHGLPVATTTAMRKSLRDKNVGYVVAKKTLIGLAFKDMAVEGQMPELPGEIALAYGEDMLEPAKGVYEYQKKNAEMVRIVGGVFLGKFVDALKMMSIATIPPREVLYGQFVNLINSPIQGLVIALDAIAKKKEAMA